MGLLRVTDYLSMTNPSSGYRARGQPNTEVPKGSPASPVCIAHSCVFNQAYMRHLYPTLFFASSVNCMHYMRFSLYELFLFCFHLSVDLLTGTL